MLDNNPNPNPDKGKFNGPLIIVGVLLLLLAFYLYKTRSHPTVVESSHYLMPKVAGEPSAAQNAPPNAQEAPAGFEVGGTITQMYFAEKSAVQRGQILASLDKAPFEERLAAAKVQLQRVKDQYDHASARSNPNFDAIEAARLNLDAAQHTYDVARDELSKRAKQVVIGQTDNVYDDDVQNEHDAKVDVENRKAELAQQEAIGREKMGMDNYKATLEVAQEDVNAAESALAAAQLHAPADGVVASVYAQVGAAVAAGDPVYGLSPAR